MITIKLPIQIESPEAKVLIADQRRRFSSCVRYSFNRYQDGKNEKEIRALTKDMFKLGCWLTQSAIKEAEQLHIRFEDKKIVFGGKFSRKQYLAGKITKAELKEARLLPLCSFGEGAQSGNRFFTLDLVGKRIFYKPAKGTKIEIRLPHLRKKMANKLKVIEELAKQKKLPLMFKLTNTHVFISFDEVALQDLDLCPKQLQQRILGIDFNPNYIGFGVLEFAKDNSFKVIHKEVLDLTTLTKKSGLSSSHLKQKAQGRKLNFEQLQCISYIVKLAKHYQCCKIVVEDLSSGISTGSKRKGSSINRLINNQWHVQKLISNLKKHCCIENIEFVEVNPAYSSFVGNIQYGSKTCPDPIAASIEIARRGFKKYDKGWFYPTQKNIDNLEDLWKKKLDWSSIGWKQLSSIAKESKVKYRFSLEEAIPTELLRLQSYKSGISLYKFV